MTSPAENPVMKQGLSVEPSPTATPEAVTEAASPPPIFVFGSNLAGRHGKGAALWARQHRGAIYGRGVGMQGRSYAIPTKDHHLRTLPLASIAERVKDFLRYAADYPGAQFQLTPIGCGLAGYTHAQIAPMFADAPPNVALPDEFKVALAAGQAPSEGTHDGSSYKIHTQEGSAQPLTVEAVADLIRSYVRLEWHERGLGVAINYRSTIEAARAICATSPTLSGGAGADEGGRDPTKRWARDLTDEELFVELKRVEAGWDWFKALGDDDTFGGGSPGEGTIERLDELDAEIKKRGLSQPSDQT